MRYCLVRAQNGCAFNTWVIWSHNVPRRQDQGHPGWHSHAKPVGPWWKAQGHRGDPIADSEALAQTHAAIPRETEGKRDNLLQTSSNGGQTKRGESVARREETWARWDRREARMISVYQKAAKAAKDAQTHVRELKLEVLLSRTEIHEDKMLQIVHNTSIPPDCLHCLWPLTRQIASQKKRIIEKHRHSHNLHKKFLQVVEREQTQQVTCVEIDNGNIWVVCIDTGYRSYWPLQSQTMSGLRLFHG